MGSTRSEAEEEINQMLLTITEGYSDSVIPPLSQIFPPYSPSSSSVHPATATIAEMSNNNNTSRNRKRGRPLGNTITAINGEGLHHIQVERDRRLKMNEMFNELQAIVPAVSAKVDQWSTKEVIVEETIKYIKELEKKKQRLAELKESMKPVAGRLMLVPYTDSNRNCSTTVTVSGNVAFFGIQAVSQPGLLTVIFKVFYKHHAEILAANISVNEGQLTLAITALDHNGDGNGTCEKIKREILSL